MDRDPMMTILPESPYRSLHRPGQGDVTACNKRCRPSCWSRFGAFVGDVGAKLRRSWLPTPHDTDPLEWLGFEEPTRERPGPAIVTLTPDGPLVTAVIVQRVDGEGRTLTVTRHKIRKDSPQ